MIIDDDGNKTTPKEAAKRLIRVALGFFEQEEELEAWELDFKRLTKSDKKKILEQYGKLEDRIYKIIG
jgi:predicted GIY-YIG superfamily endonuclease